MLLHKGVPLEPHTLKVGGLCCPLSPPWCPPGTAGLFQLSTPCSPKKAHDSCNVPLNLPPGRLLAPLSAPPLQALIHGLAREESLQAALPVVDAWLQQQEEALEEDDNTQAPLQVCRLLKCCRTAAAPLRMLLCCCSIAAAAAAAGCLLPGDCGCALTDQSSSRAAWLTGLPSNAGPTH